MDANKLAILTNDLGGYDVVEDLLGVDAEVIQRAVEGESLSRLETAELETAYNQLIQSPDLATGNNIDLDRIDTLAERLSWTRRYIDDRNFADEYRKSIADGVTSLDDVAKGGGLFADLTHFQMQKVMQATEDNPDNTGKMYQAYYADTERGTFNQIKTSEFWAWFREIFYSD